MTNLLRRCHLTMLDCNLVNRNIWIMNHCITIISQIAMGLAQKLNLSYTMFMLYIICFPQTLVEKGKKNNFFYMLQLICLPYLLAK